MLAIIVHGGMEDTVIPPHLAERRNSGAKRACELGYQTLVRGSALDAVEAAVRCMEDDPILMPVPVPITISVAKLRWTRFNHD